MSYLLHNRRGLGSLYLKVILVLSNWLKLVIVVEYVDLQQHFYTESLNANRIDLRRTELTLLF